MPPDLPSGSSHPADANPQASPARSDSTAGLEALQRLLGRTGVFERYQLEGEIARGGMGAILRVWDKDLQRHLAMKVVLGQGEAATSGKTPPVDSRRLARFLEEAQVTSQLDHPGIVPVHELGLDSKGCVYFTMKLVKGKTLKDVFDELAAGEGGLTAYATTGEHVRWTQARVLGLIQRVCEAMAYAHHKGVIHRDLKPANVMVGRFGEVYVMDWGLARVLDRPDPKDLRIQPSPGGTSEVRSERREVAAETPDSPLVTMDGDVVGTPSFMSPEQAAGRVSEMGPASDVYAVGAMLYQMLAGQMPYVPHGARLNNYAIWRSVQEGPPTPLQRLAPDAPGELVAICEKAMAREPSARYRDMLELSSDLAAYVEGRVVRAHETGAWAEARKWVRRNKALTASLGAALVLLLSGAAGLAWVQASGKRAAEEQREIAEGQRAIAQKNEALAQAERDRANANATEAETRTREARWQAYLANIRAAGAAYQLGELDNLRRSLDAAPEEHRGWEWGYFDARLQTSVITLDHEGPVREAAFSPDGTRVITACCSDIARVWDVTSGAELAVLRRHKHSIVSAQFSPDGWRVITTGYGYPDDETVVWDSASGAELTVLRGYAEGGSSAFSSDGTRVLTASDDKTARVWDSASGTELALLRGHTSNVLTAVFSPDGTRVLTASDDKTARVWDSASGTELALLRGHTGSVLSAVFNPDGTRVLTASDDKTARVWDSASGTELALLRGHTGSVLSAVFNPDGTRVLTASDDKTARVWDSASGTELALLRGHTSNVLTAVFSPDGTRVLTASDDKTARVWDSASGTELALLRGRAGSVLSAVFSPDGTRVLTASDDTTARVWDSVRESVRIREQSRLQAAEPEARSMLEAALRKTQDLKEVADAIRGETDHDPLVRQLALDMLALQSQAIKGEARNWVDTLVEANPLKEDLVRRIAADTARSEDVRRAALRLAETAEDPWKLNQRVWDVVHSSFRHALDAELDLALRMASRAVELEPSNGVFLNTLGVAQYRAGRFAEALGTLTRSRELNGEDEGSNLAFLAMVEWQLGHPEEARGLLARLREVMQGSKRDSWAGDFLREAEALIGN